MRIHTDKTLGKKEAYFRSFFQAEDVYTCRGLATNSLNDTWILILPMEHLMKRFLWELLILQNQSKCTFPVQGKYRASFTQPMSVHWLGDPRKVSYTMENSLVWCGVITKLKVKQWSYWRAAKLLLCAMGPGEPSNRHNTTLLTLELHHHFCLPWYLLNTTDKAGFVYWHSQQRWDL